MSLGVLTLHIHLPGCTSLKEKRSRLKPLLARLQREFNISVSEVDYLDSWQQSLIACAFISNDNRFTQRSLQKIVGWIETRWPDIELVTENIELI